MFISSQYPNWGISPDRVMVFTIVRLKPVIGTTLSSVSMVTFAVGVMGAVVGGVSDGVETAGGGACGKVETLVITNVGHTLIYMHIQTHTLTHMYTH